MYNGEVINHQSWKVEENFHTLQFYLYNRLEHVLNPWYGTFRRMDLCG